MTTASDELIASLGELRRRLPSMRLGQLICNMATVAKGPIPGATWDVEDDELLDAIRTQLEQLKAGRSSESPMIDPVDRVLS
ncbi:MAG: hypothetical protein K1X57_16665 [Gemmataceae bacterium]|nr:hypothetical protein [Gemmataceae bacterium]